MIQITDNAQEQRIVPLFRLGFRPFFLFASLFSIFAIGLWIGSLSGLFQFSPYGNALWWHGHEMLFGFAFAVIVGFLLTAIQNWTGLPGLKSWPLFILFTSWLIPRLLLLTNITPSYWILALDILTPLLTAYFLWRSVAHAKQWRNLFFVPVMLLFALSNALMHVSLIEKIPELSTQSIFTMVMLVTLIMCVMGGRVIPFFTARGTNTEKSEPIVALEWLSLLPLWLYIILSIINTFFTIPTTVLAILLLIAGFANLIRFIRWRPWVTLKVPLVWSLHGAFAFIPVGLITFGVSLLAPQLIQTLTAIHFLTAGAMGSLILAMMARVSLGHTGRPLKIKPVIKFAFFFILLAGTIRTILPILMPQFLFFSYQVSGLLWMLSYAIFVWVYGPILSQSRIDGRPG
ncbi:MAG: NnrS family protein [Gammaproteobacteria bacterium]|nr:NnrS family protein [Gammaproteobacteria bacterium]